MRRWVRLYWLVLPILILSWSLVGRAEEGNFLGINLGDTKGALETKLQSLEKSETVRRIKPYTLATRFIGKNVNGQFDLFQDKLYLIRINFEKMPLNTFEGELKTFVMEKVIAEVTKGFGKPVEDYGYPENIEGDGSAIVVSEWSGNGKGATVSIMRWNDGYQVEIELYDLALKAAAEEAEWLSQNQE